MLQGAVQPAVDHAGRPPGAEELAVAFEPGFAGGIAAEVAALGVRQQRTQMQCGDAVLDIDVHHHRGVLAVGAAGRLGVPAGLDQPQERLDGARQWRPLL